MQISNRYLDVLRTVYIGKLHALEASRASTACCVTQRNMIRRHYVQIVPREARLWQLSVEKVHPYSRCNEHLFFWAILYVSNFDSCRYRLLRGCSLFRLCTILFLPSGRRRTSPDRRVGVSPLRLEWQREGAGY